MPAPTDRNRLDEEESPYLQAHADNPVNWQPWDEQALAAAREHDVPIFLSIGYSACHWCHVMAEESFEDADIATRLNEHFVPIKLDREERPDIDSIYMTVCQLVNRSGCGWPLSVWLTPEGDPFYVGTYFPKESSHGRPGFGDVLTDIADQWETDKESLVSRGRQWMNAVRSELESTGEPSSEPLGSQLLDEAGRQLISRADREYGGFGGGQKFPQPSRLELLALVADRADVEGAADVLTETPDAMADGGLRDHLGGGFHRYCVDRDWTVPHFEKMLYDNAGIAKAFLTGYTLTGTDRYADIAAETFEFVHEELRHPDGAFFSTLDARSHPPADDADTPGRGVEGAFYVWTPESVSDAIGSDLGDHRTVGDQESDPDPTVLEELVTSRYGITQTGNFEGQTVLTIAESVESLAETFDRDTDEIERLLEVAVSGLQAYRSTRPRPPRDEKVLAGWNGLMIDALANGALVLQSEQYASWAQDALSFVQAHLWDGEQLYRRYKEPENETTSEGDVKGDGTLEDYAFLARGALTVYEATGSVDALSFAIELSSAIKRQFWDSERGTLFYTAEGTSLPVRPQEVADQATPSSTGIALQVLQAMDAFAPAEDFGSIVSTVLQTHGDRIRDSPMQHPSLVLAHELRSRGRLEVVISADQTPADWMGYLGTQYLPDRLIAHRPPSESGMNAWIRQLGVAAVPPIWAGREARSGPTAYVCRHACSPPITDIAGLEEWVEEYR